MVAVVEEGGREREEVVIVAGYLRQVAHLHMRFARRGRVTGR